MYCDELYKQVDGVTMGNCLAPTFANFFLGHLEDLMFKDIKEFYPKFYRRYVDDIFCIFSKQSDAMCFLELLNKLHPNLQFTLDLGTKKLPFLDVNIELTENGFNSWVYRKPTHTGVLLNFFANVPTQWKTGLITCLLTRANTICSSVSYFKNEVCLLKTMFLNNGYPERFFDKVFRRFQEKLEDGQVVQPEPDQSLVDAPCSDEGERRRVVFKMPYFGVPSRTFAKKLSALIEHSLGVEVCVVYTSLKLQSFFRLKSATPFPLSSCVVYKFDCVSDPDLSYVGQTYRHLEERVREHLTDEKDSGIGSHVATCPDCVRSNLGVDNFQVIKRCRTAFDAKVFEAFYIQRLQPKLNVQVFHEGAGYLLKVFK